MVESLPFQYEKRDFWEFYCPICKNQRRSFYWPAPRVKHYVALGLFALVATAILWPWAGFKGFFLNFPIWALFEFFYRARARQSLICPHCGFDPYLYKYDVNLARQKVERFFEAKKAEMEKVRAVKANGVADARSAKAQPAAGKSKSQSKTIEE